MGKPKTRKGLLARWLAMDIADRLMAVGLTLFVALSLVAIIVAAVKSDRQPSSPVVTDTVRIVELDEEFGNFIGPGHAISEYDYIDCDFLTGNADAGYGPLADFARHTVLVGQTGVVGILCYGYYDSQQLLTHGGAKLTDDQTFIVVCNGSVAPQPWWNHIVLATDGYNLKSETGQILPYAQIWVPLPEDATPDSLLVDEMPVVSGWYWDGYQYIEKEFNNTMTPDQNDLSGPEPIAGPQLI